MVICERCSISLLILCCKILRWVNSLMVDMCMDSLIPMVMMTRGRTFQPCGVNKGQNIACLSNFQGCGCFRESIVVVDELNKVVT